MRFNVKLDNWAVMPTTSQEFIGFLLYNQISFGGRAPQNCGPTRLHFYRIMKGPEGWEIIDQNRIHHALGSPISEDVLDVAERLYQDQRLREV